MSQVDKLCDAGIIDEGSMDDAHKTAVNNLSDDEVTALISVHGKVKHTLPTDEQGARPTVL